MKHYFILDERLGIHIPYLEKDWENISKNDQHTILLQWESIRGHIPDRIKELECTINTKQHQLDNEGNFEKSCILNREISELASVINDLWIWYRTNQDISSEKLHA
ncbi:hypothetical protein ACFDTO_11990 [Microbacteriaceae bacterium 4G12]